MLPNAYSCTFAAYQRWYRYLLKVDIGQQYKGCSNAIVIEQEYQLSTNQIVRIGYPQPQQVISNAAASDLPALSEALHQQLRDFYYHKVREHIRGGI